MQGSSPVAAATCRLAQALRGARQAASSFAPASLVDHRVRTLGPLKAQARWRVWVAAQLLLNVADSTGSCMFGLFVMI